METVNHFIRLCLFTSFVIMSRKVVWESKNNYIKEDGNSIVSDHGCYYKQ